MLAVTVLFLLLMLSFGMAVFSDPGAVPEGIAFLYRGLREEFLLRQEPGYTYPGASAQGSQGLPPQLRGIVGREAYDGDSEGEDVALAPAKALQAAREQAQAPQDLAERGEAAPQMQQAPQRPRLAPPPLPNGMPWERLARIPQLVIPAHVFTRPGPHDPRFCRRSRAIKPPRAHFCSTCDRVVLKMDHHCPWVANCVGYGNYKAFLLLILHGWGATLCVLCWWLPAVAGWWQPLEPLHYPSSSSSSGTGSSPLPLEVARSQANAHFTYASMGLPHAVGFILSISFFFVLSLFAGMHVWLVVGGKTTLEMQLLGTGKEYSFGSTRRNWDLVFGSDWRRWAWPARTGDVDWATLWGTQWQRYVGEPSMPRVPEYLLREEGGRGECRGEA